MAKTSLKSPRGVASYPHLNKADFKFDEEGKFKVDLIVPKDEATETFVDAVKSIATEAFGKKASEAHMPFFDHAEDDTKLVLRFSSKWEPKIYDVHGDPASREGLPIIGSGSVLKINTTAESWEGKGTGVKLYLNDVQVITMVEYGAPNFDDEGEGWEPEMASGGFADESSDKDEGQTKAAPSKKSYGF
jgi:hypothetical protein